MQRGNQERKRIRRPRQGAQRYRPHPSAKLASTLECRSVGTNATSRTRSFSRHTHLRARLRNRNSRGAHLGFSSMRALYDRTFACMEVTVHGLEGLVPTPRLVDTNQGRVYRYEQCLAKQAIVQKLARLVSTLRSTQLLLDRGFVQEVGTLERVLDEILEDVHFLVVGLESPTKLHAQFLQYFHEEEFDADTARASTQKRRMIPRKRIRAHFGRIISSKDSPQHSTATTPETSETA